MPRQNISTGIRRSQSQLRFDAQQTIVFGDPVGAAQRTRLDLARSGTHRQIRDGGIFRLARPMGNHRRVARRLGHSNGLQRLSERTDLIELDQDGVGDSLIDTALENLCIGHEQVVSNQLDS